MSAAREDLILKYAMACKRNAAEMAGMPITVICQHFREFADELAALSTEPGEAEGWQPIETAPHACHVLAARFDQDCGEWVVGVVMSPPSYPFTHWRMLPAVPLPEDTHHGR